MLNYVTYLIFTVLGQGICGCDRFKSGSIGDVFWIIVKKDGYRGLMRGWMPRMLFHAPAAAICWSTYEAAKAFFQEHNPVSNSVTWTREYLYNLSPRPQEKEREREDSLYCCMHTIIYGWDTNSTCCGRLKTEKQERSCSLNLDLQSRSYISFLHLSV